MMFGIGVKNVMKYHIKTSGISVFTVSNSTLSV